jgi:pimeloyl-ACP methyl ester carboxylesterase
VLAHGAGSGPWVFADWARSFPGVTVETVDLQAGLDVARASMEDFARALVETAERLSEPTVLLGWSLGGLAVLMSAERVRPAAVVLLESSPPAEVQGSDPQVALADGTFDPEELYGAFPSGIRARPESSRARAERKRGVSVASLPCRSLVVSGSDFPDDRGSELAALYGSDQLAFPDLDHWGLVLDERVRKAIARWLASLEPA